jgi:hypothetical protein
MILRKNLFMFGKEFPSGTDARREALEEKGFISPDEEDEKVLSKLGKHLRKGWGRWITVT